MGLKARVKATGEIVEAILTERETIRGERVWMTDDGRLIEDSRLDFNVTDEPDYWTRLEHQYAGMAMQGMLSGWWSGNIAKIVKSDGEHFDVLTHKANELAHALVKKMKEERK